MRARSAGAALSVAAVGALSAVVLPSAASAATRLLCSAHCKTTANTKHATAGRTGTAPFRSYISGATRGRSVPLSVTVAKGAARGYCATSFTPR